MICKSSGSHDIQHYFGDQLIGIIWHQTIYAEFLQVGVFPGTQEWLFKFDHDLQEFLLCFSKKPPYPMYQNFHQTIFKFFRRHNMLAVRSPTPLQSTPIKLFGILSEESSYIRQNKMKPLSFLTWDSLERPYIITYFLTTQETYYMIFTFGLEVWARNRDWRQESRNCKLQIKPFPILVEETWSQFSEDIYGSIYTTWVIQLNSPKGLIHHKGRYFRLKWVRYYTHKVSSLSKLIEIPAAQLILPFAIGPEL